MVFAPWQITQVFMGFDALYWKVEEATAPRLVSGCLRPH